MDRIVKKRKWTQKRIFALAGALSVMSFFGYTLLNNEHEEQIVVEKEKVTIEPVTEGPFVETIAEDGTIAPENTRFMDAIEGGVVREIKLKSGAIVKKGDVVMTLNNTSLQLDVLNREAQLYEQINVLRTTRLSMEQNSLNLKSQLAEIEYNLNLLQPKYARNKKLYDNDMISEEAFEEIREAYNYQIRRKAYTYESYRKDSLSVADQLNQLNESEKRMTQSLTAVGQILDNLTITAPIDGILSTPQLVPGESVSSGQRLGQIDEIGQFKISAKIDEIYLSQIDTALKATFTYDGNTYPLYISKVYPNVSSGTFEVDLAFSQKIPAGLKRGQRVRLSISLSDAHHATLVPRGAFYQSSGGQWAFVLNKEGTKAQKKTIKLGRKNINYYEVVEGLEPGERIITSSYDIFGDRKQIILQ